MSSDTLPCRESAKVSGRRSFRQFAADRRGFPAAELGGLGYTRPYPTSWEDAAEMVLADEARHLTAAQLYILTPQMCDVVVAAALTLTVEGLSLVDEMDLPSPTGLVVLPHPLVVTSVGGDLADDRAIAWHTPAPGPSPRKIEENYRMRAVHCTHPVVLLDLDVAVPRDHRRRAGWITSSRSGSAEPARLVVAAAP